ncbi:MAG: hypothetical protein PHW87_07690 [Methanothrix sp.]|nr:hypothetical protein [Methanothrix sp.]
MAICIIAVSLNSGMAFGENENISCLKNLLTSFDDPGMDSQDLAFFLVTHNYDATPVGSNVEVKLNGEVCTLIPNGNRPGLCDIIL